MVMRLFNDISETIIIINFIFDSLQKQSYKEIDIFCTHS